VVLVRFNPGLPADAYEDAVHQIVGASFLQNLGTVNCEKYERIKEDRVTVTYCIPLCARTVGA
jgi:type I restriction enzyme, R subunit